MDGLEIFRELLLRCSYDKDVKSPVEVRFETRSCKAGRLVEVAASEAAFVRTDRDSCIRQRGRYVESVEVSHFLAALRRDKIEERQAFLEKWHRDYAIYFPECREKETK